MASMNLARLQDEVNQRVRNTAVTDAQLTIWANNTGDYLASKVDFPHLWHREAITTVSGTRSYYLRDLLPGSLVMLVNETDEQEIYEKDEQTLVRMDYGRSDGGTPTYFSCTGTKQYQGQPSAASTIRVVSSSASDTAEKVRVRGVVSSAENYELLSLNGTTNVDGSLSFSQVRGISKDSVTAGKITVTDTTGGTTLAVLPRARQSVDYLEINMTPVPDSVLTLGMFGYRRPMDLVNSEDVPELPEMFHELYVLGMQQRAHEYLLDFQRANELKLILDSRLQDISNRMSSNAGHVKYLMGRPSRRFRRLPGRLPPEYGRDV